MDPYKSMYQNDYTWTNAKDARGRKCSQRPHSEAQNDFRERRDTDVTLKRNLPPPPMSAQNDREAPRINDRVPGPYWIRQKPKPENWESQNESPNTGNNNNMRRNNDTRRAYEFTCRRRGANRDEPYDDGRGVNPYDPTPGPGYTDPNMLPERYDPRRAPNDDMYGPPQGFYEPTDGRYMDGYVDEGDGGYGRADRKPCRYSPPPAKSGPDQWMHERDWGPPQARERRIPSGVGEPPGPAPAARVSCAPETDISKYDQPNTFMRKLYEKYPFLYNVLKETPPEELISRVFKDRFLSTYQVDFLHMGVGKESYPEGGAKMEETYTGPEGEPETSTIPGCSYRYSKKGDFGRKKFEYKKREVEEEEEPVSETEKDEPAVSEYMSTISKLGGDIITDQLYKVAQITKKIRNARKFW